MKIIEHSCKTTKCRRFTCKNCGCVFDCEVDEYWEKPSGMEHSSLTYTWSTTKAYYTCCPECHKVVVEESIDYNKINSVTLNSCENNSKCVLDCKTCKNDCSNNLKE